MWVIVKGIDMQVQDLMCTKSLRKKSMYSCWRDKKEFLFLIDEISRRRKPCTPHIGIDLLLCSDPDIYLLANCKRQDTFGVERIRLTQEQCIFFYAFLWSDATPTIQKFSSFQVVGTALSNPCCPLKRGCDKGRSVKKDDCWQTQVVSSSYSRSEFQDGSFLFSVVHISCLEQVVNICFIISLLQTRVREQQLILQPGLIHRNHLRANTFFFA